MIQPPTAPRILRQTTMHGEVLVDDYFWLRERSNPEVLAYLEAENQYAAEVMRSTEALQESLLGVTQLADCAVL